MMAAHALAGANQPAGEFTLTERDFRAIADMLRQDAGITLPDGKTTLVYSRLAKRLRALGLSGFSDYVALLQGADGAEERQNMMRALTTNVTRFFREPHHFEHLRTTVLPPLLAAAKAGGRVRLWSAACSNGQESYSLALTILDLLPNAADLDVRVLASDIDTDMVAAGRAGQYDAETLTPVPAPLRSRWFRPVADGLEVGPELRRLVQFRELNLIGAWPMRSGFDAIMCRNVAIYFDADTQALVWSRFAPLLAPGAHLYIGHSERLSGPAAAGFVPAGTTIYRRVAQ
ncbi:MAG: CheR family methyltransferase [Janthinobacterium lividum]